jgi:hypothetical protein
MKNLTGIVGFILLSITLSSQVVPQQKNVKYGILIGASYNDFIEGNLTNTQSLGKPYGINIGILSNINISPQFNILPQANIHFRNNNIVYTDVNGNRLAELGVNNVAIEVPLHFSYHPLSNKKIDPGIFVGPRYRYNITDAEDQIVSFDKSQFSIDVGFSFDLKFSEFTMRPSISYSRGVSNILSTVGNTSSDFDLKMHSYGITIQFFG